MSVNDVFIHILTSEFAIFFYFGLRNTLTHGGPLQGHFNGVSTYLFNRMKNFTFKSTIFFIPKLKKKKPNRSNFSFHNCITAK